MNTEKDTLNVVLDCYALHLKGTLTLKRGLIAIKHLRALGKLKISEVAANVQQYMIDRGVQPGTLNRELGVLQAALRYSFKQGRIGFLPSIQKLPSPPPRAQFLNEEEVAILLSETKRFPELDTFVRVALMTGQRKEAIMTLRWDQVDFKSNLIDFNDRTAPLYHRMKGRGVVPMSSALRGYLKGLVRDSDWVISKAGKQVLTIDTSWRKVMKATRFKITPHVLRHTVATTLAMKSVPMTQIARILGHSNTQITERVYAKFSPSFCKDAVEHLSV
jgi:integrase